VHQFLGATQCANSFYTLPKSLAFVHSFICRAFSSSQACSVLPIRFCSWAAYLSQQQQQPLHRTSGRHRETIRLRSLRCGCLCAPCCTVSCHNLTFRITLYNCTSLVSDDNIAIFDLVRHSTETLTWSAFLRDRISNGLL
jgi:hypothetical protein